MNLRILNGLFIYALGARENTETEILGDVYRPVEIDSSSDIPYDQHQCVPIESSFSLCYGMEGGYKYMWLPNFMKHDHMST